MGCHPDKNLDNPSQSSVLDHSYVKGPLGDVAFDSLYFKSEEAIGKLNSLKQQFEIAEICYLGDTSFDQWFYSPDMSKAIQATVLFLSASTNGDLDSIKYKLIDEAPYISWELDALTSAARFLYLKLTFFINNLRQFASQAEECLLVFQQCYYDNSSVITRQSGSKRISRVVKVQRGLRKHMDATKKLKKAINDLYDLIFAAKDQWKIQEDVIIGIGKRAYSENIENVVDLVYKYWPNAEDLKKLKC